MSWGRCSDHVVGQEPDFQAEEDAFGGVHVQWRSGVSCWPAGGFRAEQLGLVMLQRRSKPSGAGHCSCLLSPTCHVDSIAAYTCAHQSMDVATRQMCKTLLEALSLVCQ